MSLETNLASFVQAVGGDIKLLRQNDGDLSSLTTVQKTSIVDAINSLKSALDVLTLAQSEAVGINDAGAQSSTTETYSISKIISIINDASTSIKSDILGAAPAALDTLQELAQALGDNPSFATEIATAIGNRIRYDASQALSQGEQGVARDNIAAASAAEFNQFKLDVGDPSTDLVSQYNAAKS